MKWKVNHKMYYIIWFIALAILFYSLITRLQVKEPFEWVANTSPIRKISSILTQSIADQADVTFTSIDPADWNSSSPYVKSRSDSKFIFSTVTGANLGGGGIKTYSTPTFDSLCSALSGVKNEAGQRWYPPTGYDIYTTCNTNIVADGADLLRTPESSITSSACSVSEFKNTITKDPLKTYVRDVVLDTNRKLCKTSYQPYKFRTSSEITWNGTQYVSSTYYGVFQFTSTSDYDWYRNGGHTETGLGNTGIPWMPFLKYAFTLKKACEEAGGAFLMETLEQPVCYFSLGSATTIVNKVYTDTPASTQPQQAITTPSTKSTDSSSQSSEKSDSTLPWILGGSIGGAVVLISILTFLMRRSPTPTLTANFYQNNRRN